MTPENVAPVGGAEPVSVPVSTPAVSDSTPISPSEAARQLASFRWKRDNPEAAQAEEPAAPAPAAAEPELADEASAAPVQEQGHGETQEADTTEKSPIEPPRSWTKEAKERWQSLPRETQEYLAQREDERDRDISRRQTEAAEKLKGLTAKEQQLEQQRQEYESALPALLQTLQQQQLGAFSDIKTMEDVNKLAVEDPFRFAQWQAAQMRISAIAEENNRAQKRQAEEFRGKWAKFAQEQDAKIVEVVPDLADPEKASKIGNGGRALLNTIGFADDEIGKLWNGEASISLRDHRMQQILIDALRYREAKASVAKPAEKPVPPVQRPGASRAPQSAKDAQVQNLEQEFARKPDFKNAAALLSARRRSA